MNKKKQEHDGTLLFEQMYIASRVVELNDGGYDIEFAGLDAPSIAVKEEDELQAKAIYAGLDVAYRAAIKDLQETMLSALESVTSQVKEDASSGSLELSDNEGSEKTKS